jgi:hypothetical protein
MSIRYIPSAQIDKVKWDACIQTANNGLIYGYSIYLDTMAANWDALVMDDYLAVMPLPWKKKYGISYLYQPFFTAVLGVFGNTITAQLVEDFLDAIPKKFKYWDIYLNHGNYYQLTGYQLYERMNYVLNLEAPYETLFEGFRENIRRNIKKSAQLKCVAKKGIDIGEVLVLAKAQSAGYANISNDDYDRFGRLYHGLHALQQATTYGIYAPGGELVASCVLFFSHKRLYYILVGNHPNGKTIGASHALINEFIRDYAGSDLTLDFEGSDIRNLAFFYSSFGAVPEKYVGLKLNRLPSYIRWLKK